MAKKIEAVPTPHKAAVIQRIVIAFSASRYDPDGHLLGEEVVHQIPLLWPFNVNREALQQAVAQIEAQLNAGGH